MNACMLALTTTMAIAGAQSGPDKPDEAFAVYVYSSLEDDPAKDDEYDADKVTKEIRNAVKKDKKWFIVTESPEKADIMLEIVRHTVNAQVRHRMVSRVNATGVGKDWVTETWMQEHHYLEVGIDTYGREQILEAHDTREKGGTLKKAAENLTEQLETFCRENYEELSRRRRAETSGTPHPR